MDGVQNPQSQGSQNQQSKRQATRPNFAAGASKAKSKGSGPSLSSKVLVGILIVVGLIIVVVLALGVFGSKAGDVDENSYQALFLTNGQVYFGKLSDVNDPYVKLTDIYYLQVSQAQAEESEEQLQPAGQNQQISLAKLGNELHGPQDAMHVSRDQVLFWENLKEEGQVTQAIQEHQEQQANNQGNDNQNNQNTEQ